MTKQSKARELLRRTFGNTTPMQSDERMMQEGSERSISQPRTPRDYAEHLAGEPLSEDDLQPAQPSLAKKRRDQSTRSTTGNSSET